MRYDNYTVRGRKFPKAWIIGRRLEEVDKHTPPPKPITHIPTDIPKVNMICELCGFEHHTFRDRKSCDKVRAKIEERQQ